MGTLSGQIILEYNSRVKGIERFNARKDKRIQSGTESATSHGKYLLAIALDAVADSIKKHIKETLDGRASPSVQPISALALNNIEPLVASGIALKVVINSLTLGKKSTESGIAIGASIEDEIRLRAMEESNKNLYHVVKKNLDGRSSNYRYKRRKLIEASRRDGQDWSGWTTTQRLHVGMYLLQVIINETNLVEKRRITRKNKRTDWLVPTEETKKFIYDRNTSLETLSPYYLPTIIKPKEWKSSYGGGYHTPHITPYPLIKTREKKYLEEIKDRPMDQVYTSINAMQNTPYKINKPILELIEQLWETGSTLGGLPSSKDVELPPKPSQHILNTDKVALIAYKQKAVIAHTENNTLNSKRLLLRKTTLLARQFMNEAEIFFPMQLDYRGRAYCVPSYLNYQGADASKGLLMFATGKPLGENGACWLAIHGANTYGEDKISMQDRINWTQTNEKDIIMCATDPITNTWWSTADKPFQFLAFCFEWKNFCELGYEYECPLPVAVDGTCNGLQHFSAMLRSTVTGREVNLIPMDVPQDIYQKVADDTTSRLQADADNPFSHMWLEFGVKRSSTKNACMVVPYGGKRFSFTDPIREDIRKRVSKGAEDVFGKEELLASAYLGRVIYDSIQTVVHAATDTMAWLQLCARIVSKENLPIVWNTPSNFPIVQANLEYKSKQVLTRLMGTIYRPRIRESTGSYDISEQINGVSANFVHGLDASHMSATITLAIKNKITHFCMVHDSYATHASEIHLLGECLRDAFVHMYKDNDVLEKFYHKMLALIPPSKREKLPPPPPMGDLDIDAVMDCVFFFS